MTRPSAESGDAVAPLAGARFPVIVDLLGADAASVLDVGCRERELLEHLPAGSRYVGLDLGPPADVIASADDPLPFDAGSFRGVVLADVLEHLERPHEALDEAMRVASGAVVVLLPNLYTLMLRAQYLRGRTLAKYDFGPTTIQDRHRWVMNLTQARAFTHGRAAAAGWHVSREYGLVNAFRRPAARLAYALARRFGPADLWSWEYVARLEPRGA